MCKENTDCKCISDILKVINILQKKAEHFDESDNRCDRPKLDCDKRKGECNTRPVQLILCCQNGDNPLVMPTTTGVAPLGDAGCPTPAFSSVFRVERVDDCCATFRVLVPKEHQKVSEFCCKEDFKATDSFFTVDLKCVCVIRCLDDTFVDCV